MEPLIRQLGWWEERLADTTTQVARHEELMKQARSHYMGHVRDLNLNYKLLVAHLESIRIGTEQRLLQELNRAELSLQ
jgi:hypothetical protein